MHPKILWLAVALVALAVPEVQGDTAVKCSFKTLATCPKVGCAKPGSPLAVTNSEKKTTAINGAPAEVSFGDLKTLQEKVVQVFANGPKTIKGMNVSSYQNMKAAPRKIILSGLPAESSNFTEGDFVELSGFIASTKLPPHPNTGESVNCNLTDEPSNDYHINITPAKNSDETEGVVVEMIPQDPHRKNKDWNLDKLRRIQSQQLPVKVQGRLFFDSEHQPNINKTGKSGGDPRRFSLWEIHPISSFFVCQSGSCTKTTGWKALEDWNPSP